MEYPEELYRNGREKLNNTKILEENYLYARHIPGHDWDEAQDLPDFTKIKINLNNPDGNQSFNWDQFSASHRVRFDSKKQYRQECAVVGFLTETIRNINKYGEGLEEDLIDVEHDPTEINYSHCQLLCKEKLRMLTESKKSVKRAIRMTMKHNSKVFLKPNEI